MNKPLPAYAGDDEYVFVSYAHEDADVVYPEIRWLQDQGIHVWYDEGISPGSEWSEALAQRIEGCAHFLYCLTPQSVASESCRRELNFALEEQRSVLAVHLEQTNVPAGLRLNLNNRQAIFKHAMADAAYRAKVVDALSFELPQFQGSTDKVGKTARHPPTYVFSTVAIAATAVTVVGILAVIGWLRWAPEGTPSQEPTVAGEAAQDPQRTYLPRGQTPRVTLAVLPFDNLSSKEDDAYLADGLTLEIGSELSTVGDIRVISRDAVLQALADGIEPGAIGERLGASTVLHGTVRADGERMRVTVQLNDVDDRRQVWSNTYDRMLGDLFDLHSELAIAIVQALEATLTPEERGRIETRSTEDLAAFRLFQRANQLFDARENPLVVEMLQEAIALDPDYVDAITRLAWVHVWSFRTGNEDALERAQAYAERALALNADSAWARFAMGSVHMEQGHITGAIREFRVGVEIDPSHPHLLQDLSVNLALTGQLEESLDAAFRMVEIQPNSANTRYHLAIPLILLADHDRTRDWLQLAIDELPADIAIGRIYRLLTQLNMLDGRLEAALQNTQFAREAAQEFAAAALNVVDVLIVANQWDAAREVLEAWIAKAPQVGGQSISARTIRTNHAFALWQGGDRDEALALFDDAIARNLRLIDAGHERSALRLELAAIHAVRGDTEQAFEWLERAYDAGTRTYAFLQIDPMFDSIRGDARFAHLIERMQRDVARMQANAERFGILAQIDAMIAQGG